MNLHKAFSDIETDIRTFYDGDIEADYTALKVAGRALAIALAISPSSTSLHEAKRLVDEQIVRMGETLYGEDL